MSSDSKFSYLTSADLNMIRSVLGHAGYSADVVAAQPGYFRLAAAILIRSFQRGMTTPLELAAELAARLGPPRNSLPSRQHRWAIQGLPANRRAVH